MKKFKGKVISRREMDGIYEWRENPNFSSFSDSAGEYKKTGSIHVVHFSVEYISTSTYIRGIDVSVDEAKKIGKKVWCIEDDRGHLIDIKPRLF